jgi:hypothetical protein
MTEAAESHWHGSQPGHRSGSFMLVVQDQLDATGPDMAVSRPLSQFALQTHGPLKL